MTRGVRAALIALGALLLLPGACSALSTPFAIMSLPSLWTGNRDEAGYAIAGIVTWGLGVLLGFAGFWLIRRTRAR